MYTLNKAMSGAQEAPQVCAHIVKVEMVGICLNTTVNYALWCIGMWRGGRRAPCHGCLTCARRRATSGNTLEPDNQKGAKYLEPGTNAGGAPDTGSEVRSSHTLCSRSGGEELHGGERPMTEYGPERLG